MTQQQSSRGRAPSSSNGESETRPPAASSTPLDDREPPPSPSSSSSSFAAASPALGDLASLLEGMSHKDSSKATFAADGARLPTSKYVRPSWRPSRAAARKKEDDERGGRAGRPNVEVPFASGPGALREFLWGLILGFGDLAAVVRGAVTCDRTVLDKLPYRERASPRPGGAVDPEKLEGILDAQARGLFSRGERDARGASATATAAAAATLLLQQQASSAAERCSSSEPGSSSSFWARRRSPFLLPLPPSSVAVSTWCLPGELEAEAQRHRLAPPGARKESAAKGLALIAALNVALLYAGSRAPTG